MEIIKQLETITDSQRGAVIALGNFDGIHRGHQAVIGETLEIANKEGVFSAVMTFAPHPRRYFDPQGHLFELTPAHAKSRHLKELGINILFLIQVPF